MDYQEVIEKEGLDFVLAIIDAYEWAERGQLHDFDGSEWGYKVHAAQCEGLRERAKELFKR